MTIRKFFAATAIAGGFVLASSSLAFANDARTEGPIAPGAKVCIDLPVTSDPVRAEGTGDPGIVFTLTSDGILLASGDGILATTTTGVPGAVELCAANNSGSDAYATLYLVSGQDVVEAPVSGAADVSAPVADVPPTTTDDGGSMSVPAPTPVPDAVQSLIDEIHQLVEQIVQGVLAAVSAVA